MMIVWSACLSAVYRACLLTDRELHSASIVPLFLGDLELYRLLNEIDKTVSMLQFVQTGSMNLETNSIEMDLALQPLRTENAHLRRYGQTNRRTSEDDLDLTIRYLVTGG